MKKTARILITLIMTVTMLFALALPASAASFDFDAAIEDFDSTPVNTVELNVGEKHYIVVAWPDISCYTSDSSVVVVDDDATVSAVGEGTAYVAVAASENMYQLYRFDVVDTTDDDDDKTIGTVTSEKDDDVTIGAVSEKDDTSSKSTFDEIVEKNDKEFEENVKRMQDDYKETSSKMFKSFGIFAGIIIAIGIAGIVVFVCIIKKQNKTGGKTVTCPTCNAKQPYGTSVCPICGTKLEN